MNPENGNREASASCFDFERYRREIDMLRSDYVCPLCRGAGIYLTEENTALVCRCRPLAKALAQLRRQGLDQAARRATFDAFIASAPWQQRMLDAALRYVSQEEPGWLFLGGQSGCGKTHLGTAAAVALSLRGLYFLYMPWSPSVSAIKTLAMDQTRGARMQQYADAPVLYIDDLFKSPPTEADKHIAFELLSARYTRSDRMTIISSERTLMEMREIDEALAGRIAERCGRDFILNIARDPQKNYRFASIL